MRQSTLTTLAILGGSAASVLAAPYIDQQQVLIGSARSGNQVVLGGGDDDDEPSHPVPKRPDGFDPLHHLSAMSPYYIPSKEITPLPNPTCNVTTTSILIRHSAIMSNDDDREQFMQPFIDRVASWRNNSSEDHGVFPVPPEGWKLEDQVEGWKKDGVYDGDVGVRKWWFLNEWETPVKEEIDEKLSERGKEDAFAFGQAIKTAYSHLFPAPHTGKPHKGKKPEVLEIVEFGETSEFEDSFEVVEKGHGKKHKHGKHDKHHKHDKHDKHGKHGHKQPHKDPKHKKPSPPYKLWTASSERDIETATSFIKGAFPRNQTGKEGEGDGYHVQLVKVPNKLGKGWKRSLTPHKACPAFTKEPSLKPAAEWLHVFAPKIKDRLRGVVPQVAEKISDEDVLSMFMLCAYETIDQGWSGFCGVFTEEEFRDAEYYFDIRFHYMMGYGNELSPVLGAPWIKTARHLLAGEVEDERREGHDGSSAHAFKSKKGKKEKKPGDGLPEPSAPPNGTHSQLLHAFFTHRESPAFSSTVLNLYNSTDVVLGLGADTPPPTDHRPEPRQWRTSEMVSFLSHIALERLSCKAGSEGVPAAIKGKEDEDPSYVRVMVNGQQANMHGCESGPAGTCEWEEWKEWMDERLDRYSDWDGACEKDEDEDDE